MSTPNADYVPAHEAVVLRPEGMHGQHPAHHWSHQAVPECVTHGCVPVYSIWVDWKLVASAHSGGSDDA